MTASLLITLRETLEASLVVGIVLAFLHHTSNERRTWIVWSGVAAGLVISLLLAYMFQQWTAGFTGRTEEIYEGITMLTASALITWMVIWMAMQGKNMRRSIEQKVEKHLENGQLVGIFFLVCISVLREGIETVIFLQAAFMQSQAGSSHVGAVLGIVIAISASYMLFKGISWFPLRTFFRSTGILLMLFAAGLCAHGIHELQEAAVIPIYIEHVWDINPAILVEGSYPLLHENGAIGSLLKGTFGYNGNPSILEVLSYAIYILVVSFAWRMVEKRRG